MEHNTPTGEAMRDGRVIAALEQVEACEVRLRLALMVLADALREQRSEPTGEPTK